MISYSLAFIAFVTSSSLGSLLFIFGDKHYETRMYTTVSSNFVAIVSLLWLGWKCGSVCVFLFRHRNIFFLGIDHRMLSWYFTFVRFSTQCLCCLASFSSFPILGELLLSSSVKHLFYLVCWVFTNLASIFLPLLLRSFSNFFNFFFSLLKSAMSFHGMNFFSRLDIIGGVSRGFG